MKPLSGRLVIATHNAGKAREIAALLAPFDLEIISAGALGLPEPEETADTFQGNAMLKAEAAMRASGLPALADDSGLCVDALNGDPGIYSARWAGPGKDFQIAMRRVQAGLASAEAKDRSARFVCVLALARPDDFTRVFEGIAEGEVVWPPRGEKGFGYDPMFVPNGQTRTFGEMEEQEKLPLTHRARAFAALAAELKRARA
ncbi:MAG: RdgB/HAM1 family non-canonical purine NTP pyrophosphatase [Hyphomonadaceae bacterium]